MKKVIGILGALTFITTTATTTIACNKTDDSDKWLVIMPEGWINSDPVDKLLKENIEKYELSKGQVTGCNLFFHLKDTILVKEYSNLNGSCELYWKPYIMKNLGF